MKANFAPQQRGEQAERTASPGHVFSRENGQEVPFAGLFLSEEAFRADV
jgi:hypothetical protein